MKKMWQIDEEIAAVQYYRRQRRIKILTYVAVITVLCAGIIWVAVTTGDLTHLLQAANICQ